MSSEEHDLISVFKRSFWMFFGGEGEERGQQCSYMACSCQGQWNCGLDEGPEDGEKGCDLENIL